MAVLTSNGFVTSGSTFADVVNDTSTDTTYYKIWNEDTGDYYTEGAAVVTSDGWVDAASLSSMELPNDTNNFYIKSYCDTSGQSEWADLTVSIGNKASTYSFTDQSFDVGTEVTYDQVLDTTNLDADAWLKIYNAEDGSYVDSGNWIKAADLSSYSFTMGDAESTSQIWVDTFLYNSGRSGWEDGFVEAEDTGGQTFTLTASASEIDEGGSVTFTVATDDGSTVSEDTDVAYTLSGIQVEDIEADSLTGTVTVESGSSEATFTVNTVVDALDETETIGGEWGQVGFDNLATFG